METYIDRIKQFKPIQDFCKGRSVCLLGNSSVLLKEKHAFDTDYDIICRCNKAFPNYQNPVDIQKTPFVPFLGSRTDILFTGVLGVCKRFSDMSINAKFMVRTRNDTKNMEQWFIDNSVLFNQRDWSWLSESYNFSPTTGCVAFYFLLQFIDFKTLDIWGIDFYKNQNWLYDLYNLPHYYYSSHVGPEHEKECVLAICKVYDNITIHL